MRKFIELVCCLSFFLVLVACSTGPAQISGGSDAVVANIEDGVIDVDVDKVLAMGFKFNVKASSVNSKSLFVAPVGVSPSIFIPDKDMAGEFWPELSDLDGQCDSASHVERTTYCSGNTCYSESESEPLRYGTKYCFCATKEIQPANPNTDGVFEGACITFTTIGSGQSYNIGGTINGLVGSVVLQNNGGDNLSLDEDGTFIFDTELADGAGYVVTVLTQPTGQTCIVTNGTGTIDGANVTNVAVVCEETTYTVGGEVSSLDGVVVLQNNGEDDLEIDADGEFVFDTELADGAGYVVTVLTQPVGQECSVTNGTGTIVSANVTNVQVLCVNVLVGDITIAADSVMEVSVAGSAIPLRPVSGIVDVDSCGEGECGAVSGVIVEGGEPLAGSGSGSGYTDSSVGGVDITDAASTINISVSYDGPEELDGCSAEAPFADILCDLVGFEFTREELSDGLGAETTADFIVDVEKAGYESKASNVLPSTKYTIDQVSNIHDGFGDSPAYLVSFDAGSGDALYFNAQNDSWQKKLFKYDGTQITQISNINDGGNDDPKYMTEFNGAIYFSAQNASSNAKLYKYDGSDITQVSNINDGSGDSPTGLVVYDGSLYFSAVSSGFGYTKLYKYNGTTITQISDTYELGSDSPSYLTVYGDALYFNAMNANNYSKLYKYDGTNITQISDTKESAFASDNPTELKVYNGSLYFSAINVDGLVKLFKYDGTTITQISDINHPEGLDPQDDWPSYLEVYNGMLYFNAKMPGNYTKLFRYDGTTITQVSDTYAMGLDNPMYITVYKEKLYFFGANSDGRLKLFKYDGTSIVQMSNINLAGDDDISNLKECGGVLYFSAGGMMNSKLYKLE